MHACWLGLYGTAGNTLLIPALTTAVSLQTMINVHAVTAVHWQKAPVQVQAAWRGTAQRVQLHNQRRAALVIQAWWRGRQVRRAWLRQQQAAILLQALWRTRAACRQAARQRQAALQLQAWWKSCACRRTYLRRLAAIVKVLHLPLCMALLHALSKVVCRLQVMK